MSDAEDRYRKAMAEYETMLAAAPDDARALLRVGDLCLKLGEPERAVTHYRRAAVVLGQLDEAVVAPSACGALRSV